MEEKTKAIIRLFDLFRYYSIDDIYEKLGIIIDDIFAGHVTYHAFEEILVRTVEHYEGTSEEIEKYLFFVREGVINKYKGINIHG